MTRKRLEPPTRGPNLKVKTGCGTCKTRKVKCDEGRPACTKCVSTGRICQGYGLWGGGSAVRPARHPCLGVLSPTPDGCLHIEWFQRRTCVKLPGPFKSTFWETLVLQASSTEPSVFYATVALSALHKSAVTGRRNLDPSGLEQSALQAYSKAIGHLVQPEFSARDRAPSRVALIACMLFTCLEFLRGHYRTGNNHLRAGLEILAGLYGSDSQVTTRGLTDDCLVEAFSRMNLLAMQFGQGSWTAGSNFYKPCSIPLAFESMCQARNSLDGIIHAASQLRERCRQGCRDAVLDGEDQQCIKARLALWARAYNSSKETFCAEIISRLGYQLLHLHYLVARILAGTCLQSGDEMAYDQHLNDFASMIQHANEFARSVHEMHRSNDPVFASDMSLFTADIGWIPPLYFTAVHCRAHDVRWRAIRLLRANPSVEGIWNSVLATAVAEEVIRIEEGGLLDFTQADLISTSDNSLDRPHGGPMLPVESRVTDVRVVLPDSQTEEATFTCRRLVSNGRYETITRRIQRDVDYYISRRTEL